MDSSLRGDEQVSAEFLLIFWFLDKNPSFCVNIEM